MTAILQVATVGGDVTEVQMWIYLCTLMDVNNEKLLFIAYGLEEVAKNPGSDVTWEQFKEMFPQMRSNFKLILGSEYVSVYRNTPHSPPHAEENTVGHFRGSGAG